MEKQLAIYNVLIYIIWVGYPGFDQFSRGKYAHISKQGKFPNSKIPK